MNLTAPDFAAELAAARDANEIRKRGEQTLSTTASEASVGSDREHPRPVEHREDGVHRVRAAQQRLRGFAGRHSLLQCTRQWLGVTRSVCAYSTPARVQWHITRPSEDGAGASGIGPDAIEPNEKGLIALSVLKVTPLPAMRATIHPTCAAP